MHDAPLPLMHHFYGMDSSEYAERGRSLRVVRLIGRPREPTEVEERAIWQAYQDLDKHGEEDLTVRRLPGPPPNHRDPAPDPLAGLPAHLRRGPEKVPAGAAG